MTVSCWCYHLQVTHTGENDRHFVKDNALKTIFGWKQRYSLWLQDLVKLSYIISHSKVTV